MENFEMKTALRQKKEKRVGTLSIGWKIALIVCPLIVGIAALITGRFLITFPQFVESVCRLFAFGGTQATQTDIVLWNIRLPRVILALLVGAGLSASGCAFQNLFANPLATPDTLGVASGASFGAALGILIGFGLVGIQVTSLIFGAVAVILTWACGFKKSRGMNTVVLSGIMIGSLFSALVSLLKFVADTENELPAITYWLMGSLDSASYRTVLLGAPPIIIGIVVLFLLRWRLNLLPLSEDEARSTGTNIKVLRVVTVICATMMTASCVSMCGQVGWIGLLVPHMCRMKFGNNQLSVFPASLSVGAIFMLIVDTLARSMTAMEIPVSILTAILGAPFFIYLMRKSGGWQM